MLVAIYIFLSSSIDFIFLFVVSVSDYFKDLKYINLEGPNLFCYYTHVFKTVKKS